MRKVLLATALLALGASSTMANLTMKIDTANKTLYFEGSDTGSAVTDGGQWNVEWDNTNFTSDPSFYVDVDNCFDDTFFITQVGMYDGGAFFLIQDGDNVTSLNGLGASGAVHYDSLNAVDQASLESTIGSILTLHDTWGKDYSSIPIEAVPEPATAGLIGISALGLWLFRRLKK